MAKVPASKFLIETLMEGIKPMNIEKKEFEFREDSKLLAYFEIFFTLSQLWTKCRSSFAAKSAVQI